MIQKMLAVTAFILVCGGILFAAGSQEGARPAKSEEPVTLTWFMEAPTASQLTSRNEIPAYKEIQERTGVEIEWQQPSSEAFDEQFTLVIASGELPDLIWGDWSSVPGGPQKYIDDGIILSLNELIESHAPEYTSYLAANPEIKKSVTTAAHDMYVFPFITEPAITKGYFGLMIRKEWLERLNLTMPTTIDEWYDVLTAFREGDPNGNGDTTDEIPFMSRYIGTGLYMFSGAYGVMNDLYEDKSGVVHFGPVEPAFKDWLDEMALWYREGLIDPDFPTNSSKRSDSYFIEDKAGSVGEFVTRTMGRLMEAGRQQHEEFTFVAAPWPLGPAGEKLLSWRTDTRLHWRRGVAVSAQTKYAAEAVSFLDYWFSDEGNMLLNFGIEGETYRMVNGEPVYTELITSNPKGYSISDARQIYLPATDDPLGVERLEAFKQFLIFPEQKEAMEEIWADNDGVLALPQVTLTDADAQVVSKIMGDIYTYRDESIDKFIIGMKSLDEFDEYVETIRKMGIDQVIDIYQKAVNEFNSR